MASGSEIADGQIDGDQEFEDLKAELRTLEREEQKLRSLQDLKEVVKQKRQSFQSLPGKKKPKSESVDINVLRNNEKLARQVNAINKQLGLFNSDNETSSPEESEGAESESRVKKEDNKSSKLSKKQQIKGSEENIKKNRFRDFIRIF